MLPTNPTLNDYAQEAELCAQSLAYFAHNYGSIQHGNGEWERFHLWPSQIGVCDTLDAHRFVSILKSRQIGESWIAVHESLQTILFKPGSKVGLFSLRETEAKDLLKRLKAVYERLPPWLKPANGVSIDAATEFELSHGSRALAFSTNSGDSYTFDLVIVDEADLCPDLGRMLGSVKPTIDAGGRIRLISRSNKKLPASQFKKIYTGAKNGKNSYKAIFLPWNSRPDRTQAWYDIEKNDALVNTGSLDYIYEMYPATDAEALAANSQDKRLKIEWLNSCYREEEGLAKHDGPAINGLTVYRPPEVHLRYIVGIDTSEGNPTSDESSITVGCLASSEEVACLHGRFEPAVLAELAIEVANWYNKAALLVERNNHGHAVLLQLRNDHYPHVLNGGDKKPGWLSNAKGKALLYANCADSIRKQATVIHSFETFAQLASIEGATLLAPPGHHDDRATSFALMLQAAVLDANHEWLAPTPLKKQEPTPIFKGIKPTHQERNPFQMTRR